MKTLVCKMPGEFEYQQREEPVLQKNHAVIKISRIGICGTDIHAFQGTQPYFEYPRVLGHELAGELIACDNAPGFQRGEMVTFIPYFHCGKCIACLSGKPNCCVNIKVCGVHMDGGMTEYLSVPSYSLIHGDGLTIDELALIEPQSIGAHGVRRADVREGEFVLIVGAGPIGMGAMELARIAGGNIIAMDINDYRLSLCREKLHIEHLLNPSSAHITEELLDITHGNMPTVVIDATGNQAAINNGFHYMAHGGRYILIGLQKDRIKFSHPEFHKREATLMSSRNATREDFEHVIHAMKKGWIHPTAYLTHHVKFSRIKEEFNGWLQGSEVVKVMAEMD
jgi:2-desacetyl-2-hydroxyethyl bacteriochlorophyllide A dehydrogenase